MREELISIKKCIDENALPAKFDDLFLNLWDKDAKRFHIQETYVIDFKDACPPDYTKEYGAGIVRLGFGFFNAFGGLIVFGVKDRTFEVVGVEQPFDVEFFNRALSDFSGIQIECISKFYSVPDLAGLKIAAVLVPRRGMVSPARLCQPLGRYPAGTLWVRDRHEVLEAKTRHLGFLYSDRSRLFAETPASIPVPVHRSFPPSPATVKDFVGRIDLLRSLWEWMVFGDQPRFTGRSGGSGKSTLAFEFARSLADLGNQVRLPNGDYLDYVVFLSAKETELNPLTGRQQAFALRQFSSSQEQLTQILHHSGMLAQSEMEHATEADLLARIDELF